jgi:hypothetical protein
MDPQNNQNPTGTPVADPNAGVQVPQAEPVVSTPPPAMPAEPVVPAPEPEVPAMPEPVAPVTPVAPAEGTGDAGTGMPPVAPPAV